MVVVVDDLKEDLKIITMDGLLVKVEAAIGHSTYHVQMMLQQIMFIVYFHFHQVLMELLGIVTL